MLDGNRLRVALVYGGRSGEHEVSIASAAAVAEAIDPARYHLVPLWVRPDGSWLLTAPGERVESAPRVSLSIDPSRPGLVELDSGGSKARDLGGRIDVVFPLIHGTYGEDGCLQGLCELAGLPYVGSGVMASAVGMDKILMKAVFQASGLPLGDYRAVTRSHWRASPAAVIADLETQLGYPVFVKPSNLGSSVGISKVKNASDLRRAIDLAAEFSSRIIVEGGMEVREIECGVLGNDEPVASEICEVLPSREFYDYVAKYEDSSTRFVLPADLPHEIETEVKALACRAFAAIGASGLARVDFFLDRSSGRIYLNEINTIPGFTAMSVYPMVWRAAGLDFPSLIARLIDLALERHASERSNRTSYQV